MDIATGREVAVKILQFGMVGCGEEQEEIEARREMLECFYQEITILSFCNHPNVVKLLDASFNGTLTHEMAGGEGYCELEQSFQQRMRIPSVEQSALTHQFLEDSSLDKNVIPSQIFVNTLGATAGVRI